MAAIHFIYVKANENTRYVQSLYAKTCPRKCCPHKQTFSSGSFAAALADLGATRT